MARQLAFFFEARFCTGCHTCQIACDDARGRLGEGSSPAKASFRRVSEFESGGYLREGAGIVSEVRITHRSESCRHCASPACLAACPSGAITKREADGIVLIDAELCSGCPARDKPACLDACPFGAIVFDEGRRKAEKCDFCLFELEAGRQPVCIASCPMRALHVVDSSGATW
jgi:anaerobic dimethyl sulfoxide reductase subunit B (iron-sulfur subunit)